jgi:hypothetical protein
MFTYDVGTKCKLHKITKNEKNKAIFIQFNTYLEWGKILSLWCFIEQMVSGGHADSRGGHLGWRR